MAGSKHDNSPYPEQFGYQEVEVEKKIVKALNCGGLKAEITFTKRNRDAEFRWGICNQSVI